jgi:hypothetical protein
MPLHATGAGFGSFFRPTIYGPGSLGHLTRPVLCYEGSSSCWRFLAHRALAALRADSDLSSLVIFAARALPPLLPPSFPNATAAGFFSSVM